MDLETKQEFEKIGRLFQKMDSENKVEFQKIGHQFTRIDQQFEKIDQRFEKIDQRFVKIDQRFEKIDQRFEKIDQRFEKIDQRFETMDQKFDKLFVFSIETRAITARIENRLENMVEKDDFHNTIDSLAKIVKDSEIERLAINQHLDRHDGDIQQLKTRLGLASEQ